MGIFLTVLKILLIVVGSVAALALLLLAVVFSIHARVVAGYNKEKGLFLKLVYSFITVDILPLKKSSKNKAKQTVKTAEKIEKTAEKAEETVRTAEETAEPPKKAEKGGDAPPEKKNSEKEEASGGIAGFFRKKVSLMKLDDYTTLIGYIGELIEKFRFGELKVIIRVGSESAATTAIMYGSLSAAIFPIIGVIYNSGKGKNIDAHIIPDFKSEKTDCDIYIDAGVRTVHAAVLLLKILLYIIRIEENQDGK